MYSHSLLADQDEIDTVHLNRRPMSDEKDNKFLLGGQGTEITLNEATLFSSYVNLTNSIIGSGILGLPFAFAASGWFLGYLLILLAGVATTFSLHVLAICASKVKPPSSFYRVTEASIPKFTFLIDLSVASMCFGVGVSYLIVIGGLMPDVMNQLGSDPFWQKREIWVVIGFAIVGPLSCFKNLDALRFTSAMAIFFVTFIASLVVAYASDGNLKPCSDDDMDDLADDNSCVGTTQFITLSTNTMRALGVFVFAYSCQMVQYSTYSHQITSVS
jgi:amino acid permease